MRFSKSLLSFALLIIFPTGAEVLSKSHDNTNTERIVYVCTSPNAYAYHKTERCSSIKRCGYSVKKISLSKACSEGRTPCGKCYK